MPLDPERIISDVVARLTTATTAAQACQAAVSTLGCHTAATITVLLRVHDRLRCVAATGSWHVFSSIPISAGVAGRVYTSGQAETVMDVGRDPDHIPLCPGTAAEICTPISGPAGHPLGVLNLDASTPLDLDLWGGITGRVARVLGARVDQLGGPPAESHSEKLLRHAVALTDASSERELTAAATAAARDVSGLAASVLVLAEPHGVHVDPPALTPSQLESTIRTRLAEAGQESLARLMSMAHPHGTFYTLGEVGRLAPTGSDLVVEAGARSLIAVPVGTATSGGVLLAVDDRLLRPDPTAVNLMELLAAQTWTCLDRLRSLDRLREQAVSDPLTGLRHHGPFGTRIAAATPGRTGLLAIDVDRFKLVNDTYGHQAGDRVLVGVARTLQRALRQGDELYRIGGDEFVAVVDVRRPEEAVGVAKRLAAAVRRTGRTISVGVAVQRGGELPEQTLRRADTALYDVKREGRDGVRLAAA